MRRPDPIPRAMPRAKGCWKKPLPDAWRRGGQRRAQGRAEWELATRAIHMRGHRRAGGNTGLASIGSSHARGACQVIGCCQALFRNDGRHQNGNGGGRIQIGIPGQIASDFAPRKGHRERGC